MSLVLNIYDFLVQSAAKLRFIKHCDILNVRHLNDYNVSFLRGKSSQKVAL